MPAMGHKDLALVLSDRPYNASLLASVIIEMGVASLERPARNEGVQLLEETNPGLVFMVADPSQRGVTQLTSRIAASMEGELIAVLPSQNGEMEAMMLAAGADACIHDADDPQLAVAVVSAVLRRRRQNNDDRIIRAGNLTLDQGRYEVRYGDRRIAFTATEYQILLEFARYPDTVQTAREIVERATGGVYSDVEARDMLKVYVRRLRLKLEEAGIDRSAILNVRGFGYMLQTEALQGAPAPEKTLESSAAEPALT